MPKCVEDHLRSESDNQCARCGSGVGVQTAHIIAWAVSRSHYHGNLVRICSRCHDEHDKHKSLSTAELKRVKNRVVARTRAILASRMNLLGRRFAAPVADKTFVGRSESLQTLSAALRTNRTVLVRGLGGIGKTQLLLHALASVETERQLVWVDVERYATVQGVIAALAVVLTDGTGTETLGALGERLDAIEACLVFDGVERITGSALDEIDDLLAELVNRTKVSQFVVTSQVDLQRTPFDSKHVLTGLAHEASRQLLRSCVQDGAALNSHSEAALLAFAEGHPLTLRLIAALVDHLGSGEVARVQLDKRGAQIVEIQRRAEQTPQTSLAHCLSLAYDKLLESERRLLYVIANCPGGIFAHQLEYYGGPDAPLLVAGLRHWSLVQTQEADAAIARWYAVSPISSYVRQRWAEQHATEAQVLRETIVKDFGVMAAVIGMQSEDADDVPNMLWRFSQELPNMFVVVDEAEAQPGNQELSLLAAGVCSSLMHYFFVSRLPEQGVQLMRRGAQIAMREGNWQGASAMVAQAAALAQRSHDPRITAMVESMLDGISANDVEVKGNVVLARAMLVYRRGDAPATEKHAREAISHYRVVERELAGQVDHDLAEALRQQNSADLSGSFMMLGHGLLGQRRVGEALSAYENARDLMRGGDVAVNEGQILHQLGNCQSELGEHVEAAQSYSRAAACFHTVGMEEYLSNALGGLGYALMDFKDGAPFPDALPDEVLSDGLDDAARSVVVCLSALPRADDIARAWAVRKLFGTTVVVSFSDVAQRLGEVGDTLRRWASERKAGGHGTSNDVFELGHLDALGGLMSAIASFRPSKDTAGRLVDGNFQALSEACSSQGSWCSLESDSFKWLHVYLRRKWHFSA